MRASQPEAWQCVLICWGTKYGAADINRLVKRVADQNRSVARFVLVSDRLHEGLDPRVEHTELPDVYRKSEFMTSGCQAKLGIFKSGVLKPDMPAIYIDLDTVILGPIEQAFQFRKDDRSIVMFQSAVLPFSGLARIIYRLTKGKHYARGNSSFIVFHPKHCTMISDEFLKINDAGAFLKFRPTIADERFISWVAQEHMIALPKHFAVKFPTEFMLHHWLLTCTKSCLPWVRKRRDKLKVVNLCDVEIKPENLVNLRVGAQISDSKGWVLVWTNFALGSIRHKLITYYSDKTEADAR